MCAKLYGHFVDMTKIFSNIVSNAGQR